MFLSDSDSEHIIKLLNIPDTNEEFKGSLAAVSVRSIYFPTHSYGGTLYRVGENCVVETSTDLLIVQISQVFAVKVCGTYHSFICGQVFLQLADEFGQPLRQIHHKSHC